MFCIKVLEVHVATLPFIASPLMWQQGRAPELDSGRGGGMVVVCLVLPPPCIYQRLTLLNS